MSQCNERMTSKDVASSSSPNPNQDIPVEPTIHSEENQRFNMNHAGKSIALIFIQIHFDIPYMSKIIGAENTLRLISDTLESIGFEVRPYIDLTLNEIENTLLEVAKEDHKNRDCLLVYIMTHGDENGKLYAKNKSYKVDQVWDKFKPEKAPSLTGKPKIFLFDACRGKEYEDRAEMAPSTESTITSSPERNLIHPSNEPLPTDKSEIHIPGKSNKDDMESRGKEKESKSTETNWTEPPSSRFPAGNLILPYNADFLIAYSSVEGSVSATTKKEGTFLVRDFCKELRENVYMMDFMTILTRTLRMVASRPLLYTGLNCAQMPVFISTLTRDMYFIDKSCSAFPNQGVLAKPPIRTDEDLDKYQMNHAEKSIALIFNHINFIGRPNMRRYGAEFDQQKISEILTNIGFEVRPYIDQTWKEIESILKEVAKEDHSKRNCLVVTIMTHGEENGMLHATDVLYHAENVWDLFKAKKTTLVDKPKIFLFQACRGYVYERNAAVPDSAKFLPLAEPDSQRSIMLPSSADFLIAFSTMKGYVSFRNPWEGSWFIQDFCKELKENVHKMSFLAILTRTLRRVAYSRPYPSYDKSDVGRQMPVFTSTLRKHLYFYDKLE